MAHNALGKLTVAEIEKRMLKRIEAGRWDDVVCIFKIQISNLFMKKIHRLVLMFTLVLLMTGLCGCPPLAYKIFFRDTSADTAYLTLICESAFDTISKTKIPVKAAHEIVKINHKTLSRLNEELIATVDREKMTLAIPPGTTVYVSELIWSYSMLTDKTLVIQHGDNKDTMAVHYPYRELKNVKRKRDLKYTYFYQTMIYYDIR